MHEFNFGNLDFTRVIQNVLIVRNPESDHFLLLVLVNIEGRKVILYMLQIVTYCIARIMKNMAEGKSGQCIKELRFPFHSVCLVMKVARLVAVLLLFRTFWILSKYCISFKPRRIKHSSPWFASQLQPQIDRRTMLEQSSRDRVCLKGNI